MVVSAQFGCYNAILITIIINVFSKQTLVIRLNVAEPKCTNLAVAHTTRATLLVDLMKFSFIHLIKALDTGSACSNIAATFLI